VDSLYPPIQRVERKVGEDEVVDGKVVNRWERYRLYVIDGRRG
jgi:hypothetical protein